MTEDEIIDGLLEREGGWRAQVTRPDGSVDPATNLGITLPTLRAWRNNSTLTADDLRELRPAEAKLIYQSMYVDAPGFTAENIPFEPLRVQLIDFGVNSGPERAIRWLQRVLKHAWVGVEITGKLDANTVSALQSSTQYLPVVNDALVAARSYMIDSLEDTGKLRSADEEGVESRALSFFLARP